jgi:hypothetical protein
MIRVAVQERQPLQKFALFPFQLRGTRRTVIPGIRCKGEFELVPPQRGDMGMAGVLDGRRFELCWPHLGEHVG